MFNLFFIAAALAQHPGQSGTIGSPGQYYLKIHRIEKPLGTIDGVVEELPGTAAIEPSGNLLIGSWNMEKMPGGFGPHETLEERIANQMQAVSPFLSESGLQILCGQESAGHHGVLWLNQSLPEESRFRYVISSSFSVTSGNKMWDLQSQTPFLPVPSVALPYFDHPFGPVWNLFPYEGPSAGEDIWAYRKNRPDYPSFPRFDCFILSNWPIVDCWELEYIERAPVDPERPFGVSARGALVAKVHVRGTFLYVVSMHLASPSEHMEHRKRQPQIQLLLEFLARPLHHPMGGAGVDLTPGSGDLVVIAGDFNGETDNRIDHGGMPNGYGYNNEFQKPLHAAGFRNAWKNVPDGPARSTFSNNTIDYFYTLNAGVPKNQFDGDAWVVPGSKNPPAGSVGGTSDHALILLDLGPIGH